MESNLLRIIHAGVKSGNLRNSLTFRGPHTSGRTQPSAHLSTLYASIVNLILFYFFQPSHKYCRLRVTGGLIVKECACDVPNI